MRFDSVADVGRALLGPVRRLLGVPRPLPPVPEESRPADVPGFEQAEHVDQTLPPASWAIALSGLALLVAAGSYTGFRVFQAGQEDHDVAVALTGGDPANAPALITRYGCGGCHTIPGAPGADGQVAAPLGGLRQRVYVGGVARNTADDLVRWIVNPQAFSPNSAMPSTGINEAEARDVAAYLYSH